ncbi:putative two-domain glycosyltransferase [Candidatus Rhodobacter oscarellae]|uniref:Putative two-domain glycosyltransferase n=1 Tax=Candidatus Rhodobacter oscarellae TaxID=1675527 RepID=A0A0J9GTE2_9RHOB|nr:glycosyltransferase [Candidatus Rhodobacter lobularis]KMW56758.1 putative two-domain glycosyltransferase [Candidatus Rhodobacter lobularis]
MRVELIISTYNWPWALRLCLLSVLGQARRPDSLCVADDGSGAPTRAMLEAFQLEHPELPLRHVWHEDNGFQKTAILNKAVASSEADYLAFTDGDCLLSQGFVARHAAVARRDRFASGSLIRLSKAATEAVAESDVQSGAVFRQDWLRAREAFDRTTTRLKAMPWPLPAQAALDAVYPIRRTWMGSNASAFREAILAVNGFDETMVWGGEDKEFGVRLANSGVRGRQLRFTSPVVHLDHPRGYRDEEAVRRQRDMIQTARRSRKTWTEHGINPGSG